MPTINPAGVEGLRGEPAQLADAPEDIREWVASETARRVQAGRPAAVRLERCSIGWRIYWERT